MRRLPLLFPLLPSLFVADVGAAEPWRLDAALGATPRVTLSFEHRVRYEALDDQFRAGSAGDDDILMLRTLLHGRVRLGRGWTLGAELQDSRTHLDDPTTPVSTASVNALELLQAYAELDHAAFGGRGLLRVGRITLDVGSRRFVARNRFRNTINGFTGVDWEWKAEGGATARVFYVLPLRRRPFRADSVRDDDVQLDEESFDVQLWGLHASRSLPCGDGRHRAEAFVFGLHEEAGASLTRNRDLYTPGLRLWREPARSELDYTIEAALQLGKSRTSTRGEDLDHFARFLHLEAGWTFDAAWSPRVALQYDYASGDQGPDDGDAERFDTLFGARRFDFGPTSLYGPFARANLNTPGVRLQVKPRPGVSSFVAVRGFWLASDRDAWTTAGVVDPSGDGGKYLGTQLEWSLRWDLLPGNVQLETGLAHLFDGSFVRSAPNSNRQGDTSYGYAQLVFRM